MIKELSIGRRNMSTDVSLKKAASKTVSLEHSSSAIHTQNTSKPSVLIPEVRHCILKKAYANRGG